MIYIKYYIKLYFIIKGVIKSPINEATGEYWPELVCDWKFISESSIKFEFTKFMLEPMNAEKCFDFIEIIDGEYLSDRRIFGPECGHQSPFVVKGRQNQMHLIFFTDKFTNDEGFEVRYSQYASNCGGDLIAKKDPEKLSWTYDGSNPNCAWNIRSDVGYYVHIQSNILNMPEPTDEYDLPITVHTRGGEYDYTVLLDSLYSRQVAKIWLSVKGI